MLARLLTKHYIPYFLLQPVSPDSAQELLQHIKTLPYPDVSWSDFLFLCPRIPFETHVVVCVHSVGLGSFMDVFGDFLEHFLWFHFIYLSVYIICLSGT